MESVESLSALSRKDLQALAKANGIKANKKSAVLIEELAVMLYPQTADEPSPATNSGEDVPVSSCPSPEDMPMDTAPASFPSPARARRASRPSPAALPADIDALSPITPDTQHPPPRESPDGSLLREDESLDIDDTVTSYQERSIRNLTMNIDTFGRISISSPPPVPTTATSTTEHADNDLNIAVDVTKHVMKKPRKSEVKTPAKVHPFLVPKSNKAQRLRREALEKKKERLDSLAAKDKPSCTRPHVTQHRRSSQSHVAKAAVPARSAVSRVSLQPSARPFAGAAKVTTPAKPFSVLSARTDKTEKQSVFIDNEISFNIGSTKTPVKKQCGTNTPCKNPNNTKGKSSIRVPDFKKMHTNQFSSQKSIVHKVSRDATVANKMDKAMKQAFAAPISQENKENKTDANATAKAALPLKARRGATVAAVSELKQKQKLQFSKTKREALQFRSRC